MSDNENETKTEGVEVASAPHVAEETVVKSKKPRTEKQIAAFEKCLAKKKEKEEITKVLKEQQRISEKEAIKQKVKQIMEKTGAPISSKKDSKESKAIPQPQSDDSSGSESEQEVKIKKKEKKEKARKKEKRRARKESSSESENVNSSDDDMSASSEDEEDARGRKTTSHRGRERARKEKQSSGKVAKKAEYYNPMDRFILL